LLDSLLQESLINVVTRELGNPSKYLGGKNS